MSDEPRAYRVTDNVRAEMVRAKHTQATLADQIGMSQQALSRRLAGQTPFTVDELLRIATVLDVSLADLIGAAA